MFRNLMIAGLILGLAGSASAARLKANVGKVKRRGASEVRLIANLGGGDGPQAKSTYRERVRGTTLQVRWDVEVEDFAPGAEIPVSINGTFVGNIIASSLGIGEIQFRTNPDDPGDGMPLPEGFPRLHAGDMVSVGTFTATYQ